MIEFLLSNALYVYGGMVLFVFAAALALVRGNE